MAAPSVSVLVPVRDASATLRSALETVRLQRGVDLECVVVDDGSTDDSAAIAEAFSRADPRFRVVRGPPSGIVSALTIGLGRCLGKYVARHDADDLMHVGRLAAQVAALEGDRSLAAVGAHPVIFPRRSRTPKMAAYEAWLASIRDADDVRRERFVESPIVHPSLFVRRDVLEAYGYRDMGWPEDYDLLLRMLSAGLRIGVVPRRLVSWRDGPGRLTRTSAACSPERIVACKAHFLAASVLARSERFVLWGHGATGKALKRALAAHGRRPSLIVDVDPRKIGQRVDGVPVVAPEAFARSADRPIVVCVAGAGPRADARRHAAALGLVEGDDFVVAA